MLPLGIDEALHFFMKDIFEYLSKFEILNIKNCCNKQFKELKCLINFARNTLSNTAFCC